MSQVELARRARIQPETGVIVAPVRPQGPANESAALVPVLDNTSCGCRFRWRPVRRMVLVPVARAAPPKCVRLRRRGGWRQADLVQQDLDDPAAPAITRSSVKTDTARRL